MRARFSLVAVLVLAAGVGAAQAHEFAGSSGLSEAAGDGLYLRLDATNDPVTGDLTVSHTGATVALRIINEDERASTLVVQGGPLQTDVAHFLSVRGALAGSQINTVRNQAAYAEEYVWETFFKDGAQTIFISSASDGLNIFVETLRMNDDIVVFNEDGADLDFRVEGDTEPSMILVDAGLDTVTLGGFLVIDAIGGTISGADGADGTAIHDDTAGEIAAVALKATPVSADVLLIEDSADSNAKKRITVGSLPVAVWTRATETTAARAAADGEFVLVNVATCVITLPAPVDNARIAVKVISSTVTDVQIRTSGAGILIDGTDYSSTGLALTSQYEQVSLISDGTGWWIH